MFSVGKQQKNGFEDVWVLRDESSGTYAEVIPSCSAILHAFVVDNNGESINVIDSNENAEDYKDNVTKAFKGCKLSPFVCRVKDGRYHFAENDYKIGKYYDGNNALHGMLYDQGFEVIKNQANEDKAILSMLCKYTATDPGYPFSYDCIVTYELEKDNKLKVLTMVINKEDGLIPITDGWHPYFTLGDKIDNLQLEFQSNEMIEFDEDLIPTGNYIRYDKFNSLETLGNTSFDNCFVLNFAECQPMCVLRNHDKKIEVEIHPDRSYPYLQFYTPPHRNSIAIENISAAPNAFNNGIGLRTIGSGESAFFETAYKVTLLNYH
jgi:aldose 1-epimerase